MLCMLKGFCFCQPLETCGIVHAARLQLRLLAQSAQQPARQSADKNMAVNQSFTEVGGIHQAKQHAVHIHF